MTDYGRKTWRPENYYPWSTSFLCICKLILHGVRQQIFNESQAKRVPSIGSAAGLRGVHGGATCV